MGIGFVGLGHDRVARRLALAGVRVLACDTEGRADALAVDAGIVAMPDAVALARALSAPRVAWLDLPTGFATELAIQEVWPEFAPGDVIVDAGGGEVADGVRRAASLASARIHFVDCWVQASDTGFELFMGGDPAAIRIVAPYVEILCEGGRWTHCGPAGSGYHAALASAKERQR